MTQTQNETPKLEPGSVFAGKYRIERLLGAGGMGVVYEALGDGAAAPVALKILHRHLVTNEQVVKRFHREGNLLRKLSGPNLVPLIDFGEDESGRLYMALGLAPGEALDLWLHRRPSVDEHTALRLVGLVCAALERAHDAGIIHRDLKPANVMIDDEEGRFDVHVLDFGLGKALRDLGSGSTLLTEQNMIFGTPEYMSPEQVRGDDLDARADLYAAGVILYELLTGAVPFRGRTSVATMTLHVTEEPPLPSVRAPDRAISAHADAIVSCAMAKDPEVRFASAKALREAIDRVLSGEAPVLEGRDTMFDVASRSVPPPSFRADVDPLAATAALNSDEAASLRALVQSVKDGTRVSADQLSTPETRVPRALWALVAIVAALVGIGLGVWVARH